MVESVPPNPNSLVPPATAGDLPPPPTRSGGFLSIPRRPGIRVTSEFDSDSCVFFHRISCKLFDSLAKLKLSFHNNNKGEISDPQLALTSKHLSLHYDLEEQNAFVKASFDVAPGLQLRAAHDFKAQQGEVAMVADLSGPPYKFELSSAVPSVGLPRATFKFPLGEVILEEKEEEEMRSMLSVSGILKGNVLRGVCTAQYKDENLNLRYSYKDEQMAFIPSISLPSNALSFAFKRRFSPSDKLRSIYAPSISLVMGRKVKSLTVSISGGSSGYWYNFNSNYWSSVYKHTVGKDFKFKAGYDSEVRLGWASLWVGDEAGKAKTAPMKMKVQFMLQVPQDDIKTSALMFRVKKRWDI